MRLFGNIPCGCEEREEIIFRAGNLSWVEGAILASAAAALILAYTQRSTNA
jgi:hypothetical protein